MPGTRGSMTDLVSKVDSITENNGRGRPLTSTCTPHVLVPTHMCAHRLKKRNQLLAEARLG